MLKISRALSSHQDAREVVKSKEQQKQRSKSALASVNVRSGEREDTTAGDTTDGDIRGGG